MSVPPKDYNYDAVTKRFSGVSTPNESPREKGVWLSPANTTRIAPPKDLLMMEGYAVLFDEANQKWYAAPDHRGEIWFKETGEEITITEIGDPARQGLLKNKPAPLPPTKEQLITHAAFRRWQYESAGIPLPDLGVTVASDRDAQTMIMGARKLAEEDSKFETAWKDLSGNFFNVTAQQIFTLSDAVLNHVNACFERERAVQDDIKAGKITTYEQVDSQFTRN